MLNDFQKEALLLKWGEWFDIEYHKKKGAAIYVFDTYDYMESFNKIKIITLLDYKSVGQKYKLGGKHWREIRNDFDMEDYKEEFKNYFLWKKESIEKNINELQIELKEAEHILNTKF